MLKFIVAAGLATALASPAAAAVNLVVNGGFESGDFAPGWTQFGDTSFTGVSPGFFFDFPTEGNFAATFGSINNFGGITQTIIGGAGTYTVSFDIGNNNGVGNSVEFGGSTILLDIPNSAGAWNSYSFTLAVAANPTLSFSFFNLPSFYTLDNVSVVSNIPEPASWVMLIAGFGLTGAAMRRRRVTSAA